MKRTVIIAILALTVAMPAAAAPGKIYTSDGKLARYLDLRGKDGKVTDTLKGITLYNCGNGIILRRKTNREYMYYRIDSTSHKFKRLHKNTFSRAYCFTDGLAPVRKGNSWGYIDRSGKTKLDFDFNYARGFSNKRASVKSGKLWGYVDEKGSFVVPPEYDLGYDQLVPFNFNDLGIAPIKTLEGKYGFVGLNGEIIVEPTLDLVRGFYEGIAAVKSNGMWGYMNRDGRFLIKPTLSDAGNFSEGLAAVKFGEKIGYINKQAKWQINPGFDGASIFSEGLAAVLLDGKWGFIDTTGKMVIEPQFEKVGQFTGGKCLVTAEERVFYIDREGNEVDGKK